MENEVRTYITFKVGKEFFCFDALYVRHILEVSQLTKVPNTKDFILGVLNLHGNIIPVADLRLMLDMEATDFVKETAILVVSVDGQQESQVGILVDMVKEVLEISNERIKQSVHNDRVGLVEHFEGTVNIEDDFIQVINLEALIAQAEK